MKGKICLFVALPVLCLGLVCGWFGKGLASPESALPGSEQDPLVTKSYVDEMIGQIGKTAFEVVEVPAGKTLIGKAGTEIILRSGSALAIDSQLGGLSDVTAGADLRARQNIPANHLLIIPRDDGRGISASQNIIVMVRGDYEVI